MVLFRSAAPRWYLPVQRGREAATPPKLNETTLAEEPKRPGWLEACCLPPPALAAAMMEAQQIAGKRRTARWRPGILGANQRRKRRMRCKRWKRRDGAGRRGS
ncbi:unnamed protein product [Urochloa humidicola]